MTYPSKIHVQLHQLLFAELTTGLNIALHKQLDGNLFAKLYSSLHNDLGLYFTR